MTSTLAWLDHDSAAHERAKRILALFQEKGTQDQLGLGGVRDSFADLLFPGTSTIQTRLRYFLFVPWIYRRIEEEEVPSHRIASVARERELALVTPLLSAKEEGVFGRSAGAGLKRLPSDVYWGGLRSWGIRRFDASRAQYHRGVDELYRRRRRTRREVDGDDPLGGGQITWHAGLPDPPPSFPDQASLDLTHVEAEFLQDRIVTEHPDSLLAWLALRPKRTSVPFAWEHPWVSKMSDGHRRALRHARLFSEVMAGAPILYNRMISEEIGNPQLIDDYTRQHDAWARSLNMEELASWSLDDLFLTARRQRTYTVTAQAEGFIRRWVDAVLADVEGLQEDPRTRDLIKRREMALKGAHSLFANQRARAERYRGGLGIGQLRYRWPDVQGLLNDLYAGLER